ncbi:hypothetical protein Slin15195_G058200 [Septoria linicola]|uniref:Uncharacterized protein n=1 Tax=Septoria linicola TaxID=215465 RepID=A0A9Q9EI65_9PEZI|nr:hypothetical protein Slin14017_G074060 [Septoria linicola]USW52501.1 hypothetical protein Slin15195_G058200 [Septoria linicola]
MKNYLSMVALGLSTSMVKAQIEVQPQNLTITLWPDDSSSDCAAAPDAHAVSFSTSVAPATSYCYNLDELFAPNNTLLSNGYYNYTGRHLTVSGGLLSYTLTNSNSYDFSANYSRLRYHQTNRTGNGDSGAGQNAAIALNVYPDRDCRTDRPGGDDAPPDTPIWNFYGMELPERGGWAMSYH